jgi:hypothetical protein
MPTNRVSKGLRGGKVLPPYDRARRVGWHHHADEQGFKGLRGGKVLPPYDGPHRVGRHHHADKQGFKGLLGLSVNNLVGLHS